MVNLRLIYVTIPNEKIGRDLADHLLDRKLIACANIFAPHTAIYAWEGKRCEESEHVMILKTQEKCVEPLMAELAEKHPYDTPCAIVLSPEKAHKEFVQWIEKQTE